MVNSLGRFGWLGWFGWFGTRWSHLLCLTFMGKVVLADGGFGGFTSMSLLNLWVFGLMITTTNNYESLDNRLTYGCKPVKILMIPGSLNILANPGCKNLYTDILFAQNSISRYMMI